MQKQYWCVVIAFFFWVGPVVLAAAQVTVSVRGDFDTEDIRQRVEFYSQYFGIEDTLYIHIIFTHDISEDKAAFIQFAGHSPESGVKQVFIKVNKKLSRSKQCVALTHEMVHVWQFLEGKLCKHSDFHYSWMGKSYPDIRKIPYHKRVWEIEAKTLEKQLYHLYEAESAAGELSANELVLPHHPKHTGSLSRFLFLP